MSGQEEVRGEEVERRGALGLGHRGRQLRYLQVLLLFINVPSLKKLLVHWGRGIEALGYSKALRMLETHPLLHGTYPIIISPWPGLWRVYTHFGILYMNSSTTYW